MADERRELLEKHAKLIYSAHRAITDAGAQLVPCIVPGNIHNTDPVNAMTYCRQAILLLEPVCKELLGEADEAAVDADSIFAPDRLCHPACELSPGSELPDTTLLGVPQGIGTAT